MAPDSIILGIDTSCDETSVALLRNGRDILANVISSQIKIHAPHGGVVPELASRAHADNLYHVTQEAFKRAQISTADLTGIAITHTPGLMGCLMVGLSYAKALSYALNIPFTGVNHLKAHLFSPFLIVELSFPFLGVVVSGGHTALYLAESWERIKCIGHTVDDAMGEAFDKAAKLLGLGYPGGPIMDRISRKGNPNAHRFTMARVKKGELFMSYSGLKTAMAQLLQENRGRLDNQQFIHDAAASFQRAAVDLVMNRIEKALALHPVGLLSVSGGVAANSLLRARLTELATAHGLQIPLPPMDLCTDNGAMVAYVGHHQLSGGQASNYHLSARPTSPISGLI